MMFSLSYQRNPEVTKPAFNTATHIRRTCPYLRSIGSGLLPRWNGLKRDAATTEDLFKGRVPCCSPASPPLALRHGRFAFCFRVLGGQRGPVNNETRQTPCC